MKIKFLKFKIIASSERGAPEETPFPANTGTQHVNYDVNATDRLILVDPSYEAEIDRPDSIPLYRSLSRWIAGTSAAGYPIIVKGEPWTTHSPLKRAASTSDFR